MYIYYVKYSVTNWKTFNSDIGYAYITRKTLIKKLADIEELKEELKKIVVKTYKEQNRKLPDNFDVIIFDFVRL